MLVLFFFLLLMSSSAFCKCDPTNVFTSNLKYEQTIEGTIPLNNLEGKYKGLYQQHTIRLEFIKRDSYYYVPPEIENLYGHIEYAGKSYEFEGYKTVERDKYEVRLKRPNNPALLGEYLAWKAYLKVKRSGNIELTVFAGLSLVEKVKYSLPNQGAKIVLDQILDNRKLLFEKTTTFCVEVLNADDFNGWYTVTYYSNGDCRFDTGVHTEDMAEGEYTRFHSDGRYYILNMAIHVIWEFDNQEAIYKLINNGNQYRDGNWILKKQK